MGRSNLAPGAKVGLGRGSKVEEVLEGRCKQSRGPTMELARTQIALPGVD